MDQLIMEVHVSIVESEISSLESKVGKLVMIPFTGKVTGNIFKGKILPGGVDTQLIDPNNVKHMSAKYMLEGKDCTGESCKIFVENEGYFQDGQTGIFKTIPRFYTDSEVLGPYLHNNKFRGEGHSNNGKLVIKFFEIMDS